MKRFRFYLFLAMAVVLASGCAQKRPDWLSGSPEGYPENTYLTAVAADKTRQGAVDRARGEIAKIFSVHVIGRDTASEAAWLSRLDGELAEQYRQSVQSDLVAVTDRMLEGVRIAETWQDEDSGEYYALAVLDRLRMARDLRVRISDLDQEILEHVRLGERAQSPVRKLSHYMQAMEALDRRGPLAADLRIVDPAGSIASLTHTPAEVQGRLEEVASGIGVGVELEGDSGGIVKGEVVQALAGIGMQLSPSWEQDLVMDGQVVVEEYRTGDPWHWSVASAQVQFRDPGGVLIDALRVSVREGSRIEGRSRTMALEKLGRQLAAQLVDRIGSIGTADR